MVRIVVPVKHVPEKGKVAVSKRTGKPVFNLEEGVMNPLGKKALETALRIKQQDPGSEVLALSLGPEAASSTLREALGMGADRAILLNDPLITDSDSLGVAKALAATVEKLADIDIVITGARTTDRYAGHVGPAMAALLGWSIATHGRRVDLDGGTLSFEKVLTDGRIAQLEVPTPCLISVGNAAPRARHATSWGVHAAFTSGSVETWTLDDLSLSKHEVGPSAAVTTVQGVEPVAEKERDTEVFEGESEDVATSLVRRMASRGLLR